MKNGHEMAFQSPDLDDNCRKVELRDEARPSAATSGAGEVQIGLKIAPQVVETHCLLKK